MEALFAAPGLFLGLIGWAACALLIMEARSLGNTIVRGALVVFTWMLWMIPAFDIVVYQGLMPANVAVTYCAVMTGLVASIVSVTIFARRGNKH